MIDQQMLNEVIIERIQYLFDHLDEVPLKRILLGIFIFRVFKK